MESVTKLFKTSAFGFNRSDVINYIEKTKNDFYDYKIQTQRTIEDLNEKIKELEEALKDKSNCVSEKTAVESVDFSSSVSQINEAADHLRETADKICDDIGDFLDKILTADRDAFLEEILSSDEIDFDFIEENNFFSECLSEDIISADESTEETGFLSQFSQIIDDAFTVKAEDNKNESLASAPSILDGLLGSSVFSE